MEKRAERLGYEVPSIRLGTVIAFMPSQQRVTIRAEIKKRGNGGIVE